MGFLRYDSPFMMGLAKVTDLIMINLYTMILCIPVVTAGAAITALHCMSLKIVRNDHTRVTKEYFQSFARNFKQATLIWLMVLVVLAILAGDCFILFFADLHFGKAFRIIFFVIAFLLAFVYAFVYPILAKFDNTIKNTLKNSLLIGILQFPKTVLMVIVGMIPGLILLLYPHPTLLSAVILFGFSGPAWISALLYNKYFQMLEDQILEQNAPENVLDADDEDVIFKDLEYVGSGEKSESDVTQE